MVDRKQFERIRGKHGEYASWAIWSDPEPSQGSTANVGDMTLFEDQNIDSLLPRLKSNVVMVGLNFSRTIADPVPFKNFHDSSPWAKDFKIRYAFQGTEYCGAYMTDVIKLFPNINANDVLTHLRSNPKIIATNMIIFREELKDLQDAPPTILAFGKIAYNLLSKYVDSCEYTRLVKLTHYSHYISKENYKSEVFRQLA
jgi:HNH endonuclease/EVE domain